MVFVEKTLARKGNRILVLASNGGLVLLEFSDPVPEDMDIGILSNAPVSPNVWESDGSVPIPVCYAEVKPETLRNQLEA